MKTKLIILFAILFFGCTDNSILPQNWVFEVSQTTYTTPQIPGYPSTVYVVSHQKGLTPIEADKVVSSLTNTTTTTTSGITVRIESVCHKYLESEYKTKSTNTTTTVTTSY